jgi:hypothetical protein
MTPDEFNSQEEANRDLVEALRRVSPDTPAAADFLQRVMARADHEPVPRRGMLAWVWQPPLWSMAMGMRLAGAVLIVLAVIGAVPQYIAWINAYVMGVPAERIYAARTQERLWRKNFTCATQLVHNSSNYAVITGEEVVVVTWACPSGDVLVTVESASDHASRRSVWVPLEVRQPLTYLFPWWPHSAHAEQGEQRVAKRSEPMVEVLCQRWLPNRLIKRRVQLANGNCYDEVINPRTGEVLQRQKAPCDRGC